MTKNNWVKRLKENIKVLLKGPKHSPAGKKHLAAVKKKKTEQTGLSRQAKKQLSYLSDADYKAVMKAMRRK